MKGYARVDCGQKIDRRRLTRFVADTPVARFRGCQLTTVTKTRVVSPSPISLQSLERAATARGHKGRDTDIPNGSFPFIRNKRFHDVYFVHRAFG